MARDGVRDVISATSEDIPTTSVHKLERINIIDVLSSGIGVCALGLLWFARSCLRRQGDLEARLPRLELPTDSQLRRRRSPCGLRPLTVDEVLHGGQAGRRPVLAFLAGLAMTPATAPRSSRSPGLRGPEREPPADRDGAGGRRRQSSPLSQVSAVISRGYPG